MVHEVLELAAHCPWSTWARPNIRWCEAMQVRAVRGGRTQSLPTKRPLPLKCAWVVTPINTFSNLAYVVAALWMWQRVQSTRRDGALAAFPWAALAVGVTSWAYHMS